MKKFLFLLILLCIEKALHAQYVYTIKADSVKITNSCDTAELIIENHTQTVPGFLFNKGRGRTEFRSVLQKISDTSYLVGLDSLKIPNAWLQGGNTFGSTGILGTKDNNPVDFYTNNTFRGRLSNAGNLLWGTTVEDGRWKMEVESGSVGGIKAKNRLDVFAMSSSQHASVVISNGNFGPYLTLGVAGGYWAWSPYTIPTDAVISTRDYHRLILNSKVVIIQPNMLIGTNVDDGNKLQVNGTGKFSDTLKLPNILTKSDTAIYKPMAVDASGNVFKMNSWNLSSTRKSATVTGSSYTVPSDIDVVFVNYTSGQATITLPTGTLDREITIKNLNTANSVILSGLDTSESNTMATSGAITVKYTGSAWVGISKY